ncbi:hypothetical protein GCM10022259_32980 [Aquimarina mytili]
MIKSWNNYIEVFYTKNNEVVSSLLRNTMNNINAILVEYPFIIRCHRSYLINTNKIQSVAGNSRGYQLSVEGVGDKIPVSRSKISSFNKIHQGFK